MKILNTRQIRELDAYTIAHEPVLSIDLMERACRAFVSWFTEKFDSGKKIGVVCGTGNNGGDGLGIARMLEDWGYYVKVWIVKGSVADSIDFATNLRRLQQGKVEIFTIATDADKGLFHGCDILIDAIFGSGLSRPVEGIYAQAIECLNQTGCLRIAVDIPSGLMSDTHSSGTIVKADYTVSFQLPKLAFMMPENHPFVGKWLLVDIGLKKDFIKTAETSFYFLQRKAIKKVLRTRSKFDHKGNYGRAMLIAGSYGKMGAAVLAARAALRSGAGLLTVHTPQCGYTVLQTTVPEAMVSSDSNENIFTQVPDISNIDAVGIGPGIGQSPESVSALRQLLQKSTRPVVIDADGLNILAANSEMIHMLPRDSVLTPHPKEFERLAGASQDDFDRLRKLVGFSKASGAIVVLKGAHSAICSPDGVVYFNSTGNPGMATGGSGDVLTGVITGLLAQGYNPLEASLMGVYLHGFSGDLVAREKGWEGIIATDIIEFLPQAFHRL